MSSLASHEYLTEPMDEVRVEELLFSGDLIVSTVDAVDVVHPGSQSHITILGGEVQPQLNGATFADNDLVTASGRLLLQYAYRKGIAPGNVGLYRGDYDGAVEVLASPRVKQMLARARPDGYIGYFHTVCEASEASENFPEYALSTRRSLPVIRRVGLTATNLSNLLGPGGVDALSDTIDRPVLRQWLQQSHVRLGE